LAWVFQTKERKKEGKNLSSCPRRQEPPPRGTGDGVREVTSWSKKSINRSLFNVFAQKKFVENIVLGIIS